MAVETSYAVASFMRRCKSKGLSADTIAAYAWALGEFQRRYPGTLPEEPDALEEHLAGLTRLSVRSRWDVWRTLRTFYNHCHRRLQVGNAAAAVEAPQLRRGQPKALTERQVRAVLGEELSRRDRAMLVLLLDTGLRRGEMAGLTRQDVHEEAIAVSGKTGRRYVPLSTAAARALMGVELPWQSDRGTPLTRSGVYQVVKRALRRAGIRRGGPHLLRHTFGVHYAMSGGDMASLQSIMGHVDASSTLIYLRLAPEQVRSQHARYSRLVAGGEGENEG